MLLVMAGQQERCWALLRAWLCALLITLALFPFFPAVAAHTVYNVGPKIIPFVEAINGLRDGSIRVLDGRSIVGMITFPSFHATAAVLIAWGFSGIRVLKWPAILLNVLMTFTAIYVGGHYLIDILAGLVIAVVALTIVTRARFSFPPGCVFQRLRSA